MVAVAQNQHGKSYQVIRNIYLYMVAVIGLITFIFGAVGIINNLLQNYVFHVNDYAYAPVPYPGRFDSCAQPYPAPPDFTDIKMDVKRTVTPTKTEIETCQKEQQKINEQNRWNNIGRELSVSIAQIAIGLPLWLFHWGIIQREHKRRQLTIRN